MKIIYYVHGTTYDNASKKCSGWKQVELNELGKEQAVNLGKNTPYKFDVLFTSDLVRAKESAKLAFSSFKTIEDSRLRECNYGDYDGEDKKLVVYEDHIDEPFPNGESLKDVEKRVRDFLKDILKKYPDKTIGIIAHRAPQLAIEVITKNITWEEANKGDWRKTGDWMPGWVYNYDPELESFIEFKKNYKFKQKEIIESNGKLYCDGLLLEDENNHIEITDKWIDVGYKYHEPLSKLLSNLFHYEFEFRGYKLNSIESFFQGIKFKDIDLQKEVFKYYGLPAVLLKETSDYDWKKSGYIYFEGKKIKRDSKEYDLLVTELYVSAVKNPFFRNAIKKCDLPIIHSMGKTDKKETVFTRYEYEFMLNCLHDYLNK